MNKNRHLSVQETWDTIAQSFDKTRSKPWKQCTDFINTLSKNDIVGDIGCGNGRHLILLANQCKKTIALDVSKKLLQISQKRVIKNKLKNVNFIHSDAVDIPLKNNSLDTMIFIASLHNISGKENRIHALQEIKRILKKNGKAQISVWSRWQDRYRKQFLKEYFAYKKNKEFGDTTIYWRHHGLNIPRFYHLYSKKEIIDDIKKANLEILDIQDVKLHTKKHPDNYFVIVKKE